MLDAQSNARPFFRPFENAWHHQTVEWLRKDTYQDGMPSDLRSTFESELQDETSAWQAALSKAQSDVCVCVTRLQVC